MPSKVKIFFNPCHFSESIAFDDSTMLNFVETYPIDQNSMLKIPYLNFNF